MRKNLCALAMAMLVVGGCFSAPSEPDWSALSEGLVIEDISEILDADSSLKDVIETVEQTDTADVVEDDGIVVADTVDPTDVESEDAEAVDATVSCTELPDKEGCTLVGASRCDQSVTNAVEVCFEPTGDVCPYWKLEFCETFEVCLNGACICEPVCPEDGTCGVDDGCGGTCGCEEGLGCMDGQCQCIPNCPEGVDHCGLEDGCGGFCPDECLPIEDEEVALCNEKKCTQMLENQKQCVQVKKDNNTICGDSGEVCTEGVCGP